MLKKEDANLLLKASGHALNIKQKEDALIKRDIVLQQIKEEGEDVKKKEIKLLKTAFENLRKMRPAAFEYVKITNVDLSTSSNLQFQAQAEIDEYFDQSKISGADKAVTFEIEINPLAKTLYTFVLYKKWKEQIDKKKQ